MSGNTKGLSDEEFRDTLDMLGRMKVAELKDLCKSMGFKMTGKKIDLYERLAAYFAEGKNNNDITRLLTMRTLILKRDIGQPLPGYTALSNAIDRGDFNPTEQAKKPAAKFVHHKADSQPYRDHSLYFKESPFYRLKRIINGSPQLMKASKGKEVIDFKFSLNFEDISLLKSKDDAVKLYLLCGVLPNKPTLAVPIEYPSPIEIQANGETVMNYKGIKGKEGTAKPADLTPYIKSTQSQNKVTVSYYQTEEAYLSYIYLVQTISCETIIDTIKSKAHIHRDSTIRNIKSQNEDDDIVVSNASVTLRDPLSYTRMKYPVQSIYCKHTQCFDGLIFLQSQLQIPTWICPHCQIPISIDDLAISDYFEDILNSVSNDVDSVRLNDDGSWEVVINKDDTPTRKEDSDSSKPEKSNTSILRAEIEIISLSSDSEDESDPPTSNSKEISHADSNQPQFSQKISPSINTNGIVAQTPGLFQELQLPQYDTSRQNLAVLSNINKDAQTHINMTSHSDSTTSNETIHKNSSDNNHKTPTVSNTTIHPTAISQILNNGDESNSAESNLSDKERKLSSSNELTKDPDRDNVRQTGVPSSDQSRTRTINTDSTNNSDPSTDTASNSINRNVPETQVGGSLNNSNQNNIHTSSLGNDTNHPRRQIPNIFIPSRKPRPFLQSRDSHPSDNSLSPNIPNLNTADNTLGAVANVVTSESNNDLQAVPTTTKTSEIESTAVENTTIDHNWPLQPEFQKAKPTSVKNMDNSNSVPSSAAENSFVNGLDRSNNVAVNGNRGTNINTSPEEVHHGLNDDEDEIPLAKMQRNKPSGSIITQQSYAVYNSGSQKGNTDQTDASISRTESNSEVPGQTSTTDDIICGIHPATGNSTTPNISPPVLRHSLSTANSNSNAGLVTSAEDLNQGSQQFSTNGMLPQQKDPFIDNLMGEPRYLHSDNHGPTINSQYGQVMQPESDNFDYRTERIRAYIKSQFEAEVANIERNYAADRMTMLQGTTYTQGYPESMKQLLMAQDSQIKKRNLEMLYKRKVAALNQTREKYANMLNMSLTRLRQRSSGAINGNPGLPAIVNSNQLANPQWHNGASNANTTDNYMPLLGGSSLFNMQQSPTIPPNGRSSDVSKPGLYLTSLGQNNNPGSQLPIHATKNVGFSNISYRDGGTPLIQQQQPILPPLDGRHSTFSAKNINESNGIKRQKVKGLLGIELNEDSIGLTRRVNPPNQNVQYNPLPPNNQPHIHPTRLDVLDSIPKDWNSSILSAPSSKNPNQNC